MSLSNKIKLGIIIPFQISSILCHIVIIYYIIHNRQLREALHNHVILTFLIINYILITIDLSMTDSYLNSGFVEQTTTNYCLIWNFIDSFSSVSLIFLMMWGSFERHLIIFYDRTIYVTNLTRFIFHYMPIIILIIYSFIFHTYAILISPNCSNSEHFNYEELFCERPCYIHENIVLSSIDLLIHKILCSLLIFIFNISLLIRIIYEKKRRHQVIRWRKHRKMAIQILSISTLYFIGVLPSAISESIHLFSGNQNETPESLFQEELFLYMFYFISLIIPFVCLMSLPEIYGKIPFLNYRTPRIHTASLMTHPVRRNQIDVIGIPIQQYPMKQRHT